jgi:hypothetical protein
MQESRDAHAAEAQVSRDAHAQALRDAHAAEVDHLKDWGMNGRTLQQSRDLAKYSYHIS